MRIVVGISGFGARHVLQASLVFGKILVLFQGDAGESGEWMSRGFKNQLYGTFKTLHLTGQACLLSAMIAPVFVGLATDILRVPLLVLFEKAEFVIWRYPSVLCRCRVEEWKLDTFCDLHESQRFGSLCIPRDCWSRFGCRGLPLSLGMVVYGTLESWSESNLAKKLESVNERKWIVDFEKFKLGCLYCCCVNVEG